MRTTNTPRRDHEAGGGWRQIGGDVNWSTYGVVLAKEEPDSKQVLLVRIEPWLEHDKHAAVTEGLYAVDEAAFSYRSLASDRHDTVAAMASLDMEVPEYERLGPAEKAAVLASHFGYDQSRSVSRLEEALPAPPDEIAFWHGKKETIDSVADASTEMKRAVLDANFETRLTFGELPDDAALEFALGDAPPELSLEGQDALAFEYATEIAGVSGRTDTVKELTATLRALANAPSPEFLDPDRIGPRTEDAIERWDRRYGDPGDEEEGIAAAAQALASSILSSLGFEWV